MPRGAPAIPGAILPLVRRGSRSSRRRSRCGLRRGCHRRRSRGSRSRWSRRGRRNDIALRGRRSDRCDIGDNRRGAGAGFYDRRWFVATSGLAHGRRSNIRSCPGSRHRSHFAGILAPCRTTATGRPTLGRLIFKLLSRGAGARVAGRIHGEHGRATDCNHAIRNFPVGSGHPVNCTRMEAAVSKTVASKRKSPTPTGRASLRNCVLRYWQPLTPFVRQIDEVMSAGIFKPFLVIRPLISSAVSGCGMADCTPTRTRPCE